MMKDLERVERMHRPTPNQTTVQPSPLEKPKHPALSAMGGAVIKEPGSLRNALLSQWTISASPLGPADEGMIFGDEDEEGYTDTYVPQWDPEASPHLPAFHDFRQVFPELSTLKEPSVFRDIQQEAGRLRNNWIPWPETHGNTAAYKDWKVFPLVYCFPGSDPSKLMWVEHNCNQVPKTFAALKAIGPRIRTALFSRMGPSSWLSCHRGWADLANHVLRTHLSVIVPGAPQDCGVEVEKEREYHSDGEILVFDDSKLHLAFNKSDQERVVLIIDMARPDEMPQGCSQGTHTDALDDFIRSQLSAPRE